MIFSSLFYLCSREGELPELELKRNWAFICDGSSSHFRIVFTNATYRLK